jgi:hypothetical protein
VARIFMDAAESRGSDTFLGAPDVFSGPQIGRDVTRPVVGNIGGKGPDFYPAIGVTPLDCEPDDLFVGFPCLLRGPKFDFALADPPAPGTDNEREPE